MGSYGILKSTGLASNFLQIIGNIWAISRNETTYPDPHAFRPERFLAKVDEETRKRMDPRSYVFGAGRR